MYRNQCWIINNIDIVILNELASNLIGNHDFLSFSKYRKELKNTCCEIFESKWLVENNMIIFKISGNRFLHHMVRYLVGSMVGVCQGRMSNKEFKLLLNNPKKDVRILKAPPQGLFLEVFGLPGGDLGGLFCKRGSEREKSEKKQHASTFVECIVGLFVVSISVPCWRRRRESAP